MYDSYHHIFKTDVRVVRWYISIFHMFRNYRAAELGIWLEAVGGCVMLATHLTSNAPIAYFVPSTMVDLNTLMQHAFASPVYTRDLAFHSHSLKRFTKTDNLHLHKFHNFETSKCHDINRHRYYDALMVGSSGNLAKKHGVPYLASADQVQSAIRGIHQLMLNMHIGPPGPHDAHIPASVQLCLWVVHYIMYKGAILRYQDRCDLVEDVSRSGLPYLKHACKAQSEYLLSHADYAPDVPSHIKLITRLGHKHEVYLWRNCRFC